MLINLSNHSSSKWSGKQLEAAKQYGKIIDITFPNIDPAATSEQVANLVREYSHKVDLIAEPLIDSEECFIHIMGEMSFVHGFLSKTAYDCMCSTTERKSVETVNNDGSTTKTMVFEFVQFRAYQNVPYCRGTYDCPGWTS